MNLQTGRPDSSTIAGSSAKLSVPSGVIRYALIRSPPHVEPGAVAVPAGAHFGRSPLKDTPARWFSVFSTSLGPDNRIVGPCGRKGMARPRPLAAQSPGDSLDSSPRKSTFSMSVFEIVS